MVSPSAKPLPLALQTLTPTRRAFYERRIQEEAYQLDLLKDRHGDDLGERLQRVLAEQGITQQEFADAIGVSVGHVNHFLSNRRKPSYAVLQRMAKWLWRVQGSRATNEHEALELVVQTVLGRL
jgi:predicted transcriptional regulator